MTLVSGQTLDFYEIRAVPRRCRAGAGAGPSAGSDFALPVDVDVDAPATAAPRPVVATPAVELDGQVSPDGLWLAYSARDLSGATNVYAVAFPAGDRRVQVTQGGGAYPRWSSDGKELFCITGDAYWATEVRPGPALSFGAPVKLFEGQYGVDDDDGRNYCVVPDGRFLMLKPIVPETEQLRLVVVENFATELERRLSPAGAQR